MKTYYYCTANGCIYTEREMQKSDWSASRFMAAGKHKNRVEAENAWDKHYWNILPVMSNKRN